MLALRLPPYSSLRTTEKPIINSKQKVSFGFLVFGNFAVDRLKRALYVRIRATINGERNLTVAHGDYISTLKVNFCTNSTR